MAALGEVVVPAGIRGIDLDDTAFWREGVTRWFGAKKGRSSRYTPGMYTLDEIPVLDHTPQDTPGVKRVNYFFHKLRPVIPGVSERISAEHKNGNPVVAVSGRAATIEWNRMTWNQLVSSGVYLDDVLLTPQNAERHISTTESKADAIRALGIVEFSDDDGKTQLALSEMFPQTIFNWIKHDLQNISEQDQAILASRPNVRVVPIQVWMDHTQPL